MKPRRPAELDDADRQPQQLYGTGTYVRPAWVDGDEQQDVRLMSAREADAAKYRDLERRAEENCTRITTLQQSYWKLLVGWFAIGCSLGIVSAMWWQRVH